MATQTVARDDSLALLISAADDQIGPNSLTPMWVARVLVGPAARALAL